MHHLGTRLLLAIQRKIAPLLLKRLKGLQIDSRITVRGWPHIDIRNGARVVIADNVTLNSCNYEYHINMHSPVKLFAITPVARIYIGRNTRIHGTCIHATQAVHIGQNCLIAANCQIFDNNGHTLSFDDTANRINTKGRSKPIHIEDDVWIGANTLILPGVTIGTGSVIAAGSVVVKDIPPYTLAGGNPAQVIRNYQGINPKCGSE